MHERQVKYISRTRFFGTRFSTADHTRLGQIEVPRGSCEDIARPLIEARHRSCDGKWRFNYREFKVLFVLPLSQFSRYDPVEQGGKIRMLLLL